jgi:hypothetical protein
LSAGTESGRGDDSLRLFNARFERILLIANDRFDEAHRSLDQVLHAGFRLVFNGDEIASRHIRRDRLAARRRDACRISELERDVLDDVAEVSAFP